MEYLTTPPFTKKLNFKIFLRSDVESCYLAGVSVVQSSSGVGQTKKSSKSRTHWVLPWKPKFQTLSNYHCAHLLEGRKTYSPSSLSRTEREPSFRAPKGATHLQVQLQQQREGGSHSPGAAGLGRPIGEVCGQGGPGPQRAAKPPCARGPAVPAWLSGLLQRARHRRTPPGRNRGLRDWTASSHVTSQGELAPAPSLLACCGAPRVLCAHFHFLHWKFMHE